VNFRWGVSIHQKETEFELNAAIDKLMDKLDQKIIKEKEKVKEKR
jgi:putative sigma-54 modulation protein